MRPSRLLIASLPLLLTAPALAQCPPDALFGPGYSVGDPLYGPTTTADFNEDGILDVVHGQYRCAVADLNGDGILDVVAGSFAYVRLGVGSAGRGAGNFFPNVYLGSGSSG